MAEIDVFRQLRPLRANRRISGNRGDRTWPPLEQARIPDSKLARAITEFIRDTETELLFNHSSRVYHFGALAGVHRGLSFDRELLYAGAMFHDLRLMPSHSSKGERFEVDGAHAARDFLTSHGVPEADVYTVWTAIALHDAGRAGSCTPGGGHLVTAGVEMDVLGLTYPEYSAAERGAVATAFPRTPHFKEDILEAFYQGIRHKPDSTFGNVKAGIWLPTKSLAFSGATSAYHSRIRLAGIALRGIQNPLTDTRVSSVDFVVRC